MTWWARLQIAWPFLRATLARARAWNHELRELDLAGAEARGSVRRAHGNPPPDFLKLLREAHCNALGELLAAGIPVHPRPGETTLEAAGRIRLALGPRPWPSHYLFKADFAAMERRILVGMVSPNEFRRGMFCDPAAPGGDYSATVLTEAKLVDAMKLMGASALRSADRIDAFGWASRAATPPSREFYWPTPKIGSVEWYRRQRLKALDFGAMYGSNFKPYTAKDHTMSDTEDAKKDPKGYYSKPEHLDAAITCAGWWQAVLSALEKTRPSFLHQPVPSSMIGGWGARAAAEIRGMTGQLNTQAESIRDYQEAERIQRVSCEELEHMKVQRDAAVRAEERMSAELQSVRKDRHRLVKLDAEREVKIRELAEGRSEAMRERDEARIAHTRAEKKLRQAEDELEQALAIKNSYREERDDALALLKQGREDGNRIINALGADLSSSMFGGNRLARMDWVLNRISVLRADEWAKGPVYSQRAQLAAVQAERDQLREDLAGLRGIQERLVMERDEARIAHTRAEKELERTAQLRRIAGR